MKGRVLSRSAVLCLAISITGVPLCAAQQVQPLDAEWLQQMYAEGWQSVQTGVLRRDTGGGQYEMFGYGAEGLQWVAQDYEQQVTFLEEKYNQSPTANLAVAIAQVKGEIARLNEALTERSQEQRDSHQRRDHRSGSALAGYLTWKGFPNNPSNDPTQDGAYTNDDPMVEFSGVTTRCLRLWSMGRLCPLE